MISFGSLYIKNLKRRGKIGKTLELEGFCLGFRICNLY